MNVAAYVPKKLPFLEITTAMLPIRLHHQRLAVSRARHHTSCQVVARDHTVDCLGKVILFGRTLELGDQLPPCGDKRDDYRHVGVVRARGSVIHRNARLAACW